MNSRKKPVLVLDLDGTLVDSRGDLVAALNAATGTLDLPPVAESLVGEAAGKGVHAMVSKAFSHHGKTLDNDVLELLTNRFLNHYQNNISVLSKPYPGVHEALEKFAAQGWLLAVCTNKREYLAKKLLVELSLADNFATISGSDTFDVRKPDGQHIIKTIEAAGGEFSQSVMVGDTPTDINAAIDAGIPSIAVNFGYFDRSADEMGANIVIKHFDELWCAVERLRP